MCWFCRNSVSYIATSVSESRNISHRSMHTVILRSPVVSRASFLCTSWKLMQSWFSSFVKEVSSKKGEDLEATAQGLLVPPQSLKFSASDSSLKCSHLLCSQIWLQLSQASGGKAVEKYWRVVPPFLLTVDHAADNAFPSLLPPSPLHIKLGSWDFKHS